MSKWSFASYPLRPNSSSVFQSQTQEILQPRRAVCKGDSCGEFRHLNLIARLFSDAFQVDGFVSGLFRCQLRLASQQLAGSYVIRWPVERIDCNQPFIPKIKN